MKILLILAVSSFLFGCADATFPKLPDVKDHYYIDMKCKRDQNKKCVEVIELNCVKFEVMSFNPYKIANKKFVALGECETVGGYIASDFVKVLNFQDDVNKWAETKKQCFSR